MMLLSESVLEPERTVVCTLRYHFSVEHKAKNVSILCAALVSPWSTADWDTSAPGE